MSGGGFTKEAKYEADRASVPIHLLDLPRLRELLVENYENLDAETRAPEETVLASLDMNLEAVERFALAPSLRMASLAVLRAEENGGGNEGVNL